MLKKKTIAVLIIIILIISTSPVFAATSTYDLRDYINIKVKNQLDTGACWLITMSTIFETNLLHKKRNKYRNITKTYGLRNITKF